MKKELYFVVLSVTMNDDWNGGEVECYVFITDNYESAWEYIEQAYCDNDILIARQFRIVKGSYISQEHKRNRWRRMVRRHINDGE